MGSLSHTQLFSAKPNKRWNQLACNGAWDMTWTPFPFHSTIYHRSISIKESGGWRFLFFYRKMYRSAPKDKFVLWCKTFERHSLTRLIDKDEKCGNRKETLFIAFNPTSSSSLALPASSSFQFDPLKAQKSTNCESYDMPSVIVFTRLWNRQATDRWYYHFGSMLVSVREFWISFPSAAPLVKKRKENVLQTRAPLPPSSAPSEIRTLKVWFTVCCNLLSSEKLLCFCCFDWITFTFYARMSSCSFPALPRKWSNPFVELYTVLFSISLLTELKGTEKVEV